MFAYIPHDYIWMYPATVLAPLFVALMVCIHRYSAEGKKLYSQIALSFAVISATVITIDYYIQIATMQPSILRGETEAIALFSQYNPHGIFIALEELGYLMMSLAFLFVSGVFSSASTLERALRWLFLIGALAAIAAYPHPIPRLFPSPVKSASSPHPINPRFRQLVDMKPLAC